MPRSKTKRIGIAILWILVIGNLLFRIYERVNEKAEADTNRQELPELQLMDVDSGEKVTTIDFTKSSNKPTVIIHFNPGCDYCQHEAEGLQKNQSSEKEELEWLWVSAAPVDAMRQFAKDYELQGMSNVHFLQYQEDAFLEAFGTNFLPSTFIYDSEGSLIRHFSGEVSAAKILECIFT
jgi:peroxiredoxin